MASITTGARGRVTSPMPIRISWLSGCFSVNSLTFFAMVTNR